MFVRRDNTLARRLTLTAGAAAIALVAAGCGSDGSSDTATETASPTAASSPVTSPAAESGGADATGTFRAPGSGGGQAAFTYDEAAVPAGATIAVDTEDEGGSTTVTIDAEGLQPDRDFGAHVHTKPCGPQPSDSGPHYQNEQDPAATPDAASTDPAYANPENEVWLDFTTDGSGAGHASSTVDWEFRDGGAQSLVLHAKHTMTGPGEAGSAGDRLACIDVDF
ncbi:superoxide dismutase family protein [Tomitella fengzijianii]|uniref:Superoxide dismutase family protein n=1 Tax=Tomitella fengzijianii TaxID=2597660 RepID=A0A516WZN2_9ACTN|nr:superoxide dismutase family protein [Tomitella fengzijianii]QDQ96278.1 superoxide dismutase family protein [Tomitella fengzijianii]